jgi:hypothetical protein
MEHDLRYEVAQEFVDVVKGLWDCWEDGAIVADKTTGVFIDPSKVRPLDHRGRFFQVKGPINMSRCPQGHPVIIQAGGSEAGLELAARTADVVFSVVQELSAARRAYRDLKGRMAKYGRTPDQVTILPGVMPIIGRTEADARDKLSRLQSWLTPTNALTLVTSRIGYDVTGFPLDGPVPAPPPDASSRTFSHVLYETARRENMTLRDLYNLTARAATGCSTGPPSASPTRWRNGLSRKPQTVSTSFPLTSLAHWSTSSTWSCRSFRCADCFGASTRGRRCVTTSSCHACQRPSDPSDTSAAHSPDQILSRAARIIMHRASPSRLHLERDDVSSMRE